ncbi:hypothetical protein Droror1_Dr00026527 [Drosera rotundifolia]
MSMCSNSYNFDEGRISYARQAVDDYGRDALLGSDHDPIISNHANKETIINPNNCAPFQFELPEQDVEFQRGPMYVETEKGKRTQENGPLQNELGQRKAGDDDDKLLAAGCGGKSCRKAREGRRKRRGSPAAVAKRGGGCEVWMRESAAMTGGERKRERWSVANWRQGATATTDVAGSGDLVVV